jgi:hypothetical protein
VTTCTRCHRPLLRPTPSGMGRVCETKSPPPENGWDLFGFNIDKAVAAALYRIEARIIAMTSEAHVAVYRAFRDAEKRLGVRS